MAITRAHIRNAEDNLKEAKRHFYSGNPARVREHLIKAIRHITKTLLATDE
jgi:hypothetical protein